MTVLHGFLFFVIMLLLAAVPGTGVALVVARSAMRGVGNGAAVTAGIVLGNIMLVCLALLALNALNDMAGVYFSFVKYVAGAWLILLGILLLRRRPHISSGVMDPSRASVLSSFTEGLQVTVADAKALFFYAALLPAFVATDQPHTGWIAFLIAATILSVGGAKMCYAIKARKLVKRLRGSEERFPVIRRAAGTALIATAVYMIAGS